MSVPAPDPRSLRVAAFIAAAVALGAMAGAVFVAQKAPLIVVALVSGSYAVMTFRSLPRAAPKRAKKKKNAPFIVMVPKDDDEMFSVLDSLGIPVDGSGGNAKAAIYRGYKLLTTGRAAEGVDALRTVTSSLADARDPAIQRVAAVAHYLLGKVHEAAGDRTAAMAELNHCLRLAPDYLMQRAGGEGEVEH
jgi:hypothetical protein